MKKFISILLSILMIFSSIAVAGVVFAEDVQEPSSESAEGDFNYEDIPLWVIELGLKLAKVFAKLAKVFVKLGIKTGAIDFNDIIGTLEGLLGNNTPAETTVAQVA